MELRQGPREDEHTESIDIIVPVITNTKEYSALVMGGKSKIWDEGIHGRRQLMTRKGALKTRRQRMGAVAR